MPLVGISLVCLLSAARRDGPERGWGYSITFGVDSIVVLTQRSEDFAEVADMLLNHGADVNSEKAGRSTPFHRPFVCFIGPFFLAFAVSFFIRSVPRTLAVGEDSD